MGVVVGAGLVGVVVADVDVVAVVVVVTAVAVGSELTLDIYRGSS